jgi:hypothetical protein
MDLIQDFWILPLALGHVDTVCPHLFVQRCHVQWLADGTAACGHVLDADSGLGSQPCRNMERSHVVLVGAHLCHGHAALLSPHDCGIDGTAIGQDGMVDLLGVSAP